MIEAILLCIIFIIGIYFGSFFTLATYRLPKKENITHKHSYCPNCNHKLGLLDLIPLFSYIFLGAKCRYCKKHISIRYFLFELLTGIVFVLFAISLKIDIYTINIYEIVYFILFILYFTGLFLIAGIDKEKNTMLMNVTFYSIIISICYMIYSYTLEKTNVYEYVIYLFAIILLLFINTIFLKKVKNSYVLQLIILMINILIISGIYRALLTIILVILSIGIKNIITYFKRSKSKVEQKPKLPIAFFISTSNIIIIICTNFVANYIMR